MADSQSQEVHWITEPVVLGLIADLGALQVGDKVKLQKCWNIFIPDTYDGETGSITELEREGGIHNWREDKSGSTELSFRARVGIVLMERSMRTFYIARENIAAWRRP